MQHPITYEFAKLLSENVLQGVGHDLSKSREVFRESANQYRRSKFHLLPVAASGHPPNAFGSEGAHGYLEVPS
jgi:hypothetical protein